ncbi:ABC transporter permease [Pseudooceanicola nanhaiensis]|uniref:ABC transporter permease n=1 Tax=Pseudooceanicola nanhaiensis TaxID=375761 RepID=UPI001CD4BAF4|nr:ABC transporter permease [Pseudooceanicola nanhaiensis]MCA0921890.1 ABC transporter permease [Pseudooceanicola nanhaiensis]
MLILKKFLRDLPAVLGALIVLAAVILAIFPELLVDNVDRINRGNIIMRLKPPSADMPFGTDDLGRNIFERVIVGTRSALTISLFVVVVSMIVGVPLGLIAGYRSGWASSAIMRVTDVFLAVPQLILAIAIAQLLGRGQISAMIALAVTYWPFFTRTVYAETQKVRASLFVEALEGYGASKTRIMLFHILPNVAAPVIVRATVGMGFVILTAAVLGFLGVGAVPPAPDWGLQISEGRKYLPEQWWYATFPGLAILLLVLGFNLLGDGLRDLVDPRLRRS